MMRRPPRSTLFPTRRSSDLARADPVVRDGIRGLPRGLGARRRGTAPRQPALDRKSTRLNSSHVSISYAVFRSKKKESEDLWRLLGGWVARGRLSSEVGAEVQ